MRFNKLILATNNPHKIREIREVLAGLDVEILSKTDFPDFPDVEETGATLTENALLKSRAIWKMYNIPAVADDTGLEVDYLGGAPGVFSARFAGEGCTFADNNHKLLQELNGLPPEKRGARFVTVIATTYTGGDNISKGEVKGRIIAESRGESGFGYDPVFFYETAGKTFAEMTAAEKNAVSHRGRALAKLREWLLGG